MSFCRGHHSQHFNEQSSRCFCESIVLCKCQPGVAFCDFLGFIGSLQSLQTSPLPQARPHPLLSHQVSQGPSPIQAPASSCPTVQFGGHIHGSRLLSKAAYAQRCGPMLSPSNLPSLLLTPKMQDALRTLYLLAHRSPLLPSRTFVSAPHTYIRGLSPVFASP